MILFWLIELWRYIKWLVTPPAVDDIAHAEINERCPICGFRQGEIRCVKVQDTKAVRKQTDPIAYKLLRQHRCQVCGARWMRDPIIAVSFPLIAPSQGRSDLEKKDDAYGSLQPGQTAN